jgi:cobalamin synthase
VVIGSAAYLLTSVLQPESTSAFLVLLHAVSAVSAVLYTLSTSVVSEHTPREVHGQSIAMTHALRSALGVICPTAGSVIFDVWGPWAVTTVNAALLFLAFLCNPQ